MKKSGNYTLIGMIRGGSKKKIEGSVRGALVISTLFFGAAALSGCSFSTSSVEPPKPVAPIDEGYAFVWSDEFDGNALDRENWNYQLGVSDEYHGKVSNTLYWGNNELQYYTEDAASVSDGLLTITAARRDYEGQEFTSARIVTRDLHAFTYGYFEAKIKLPTDTGMWPAFWMMPQPAGTESTANEYGGWAASGEIDIMEARGRLPNEVGQALHFGGTGSRHAYLAESFQTETKISEWHTYGLEWREDAIIWFVDDKEAFRLNNSQWYTSAAPDSESAPFDKPFYIILNLAVGGNYDGGRRPPAEFVSAEMQIDYVRVYQRPTETN